MNAPRNLYRRSSRHYLNEHANAGMQSHLAEMKEAEAGSRALLEALLRYEARRRREGE